MEKFISIAIDGPSGSGKSTLAKRLALRLGYVYIDTGALYRTIGYFVRNEGIASDDEKGIVECLSKIDITMKLVGEAGVVFLGGNPVGTEIRTPEISVYASNVSKIPEVRAFLLDLQRNIAKRNNVIMDGRDIGTVVLPDSQVKVFLTASNDSRAERRYAELVARGDNVTLEQVKADMSWRDKNDLERKIAPAVPASDSVLLDNSGLDVDETVEAVLEIIRKKTC